MTHATRLALTIAMFFILLAAAVTVNVLMTRYALQHADVIQRDQYNLCAAGNVVRAQQIQLWQYIITLTPPKTAQQAHNVTLFENYLHTVFKPHDCGQP